MQKFRLFSLLVWFFCSVHGLCGNEHSRHNVIFIIADDLTKTLPCYGDTLVKAPAVERLAEQAVRFDRAYCQYPVCSPSRVSFLSGKRPEQTGMFGNEGPSRTELLKEAVFLPEHFRNHGYKTIRLGKVFHIGRDIAECWDVSEDGTPENRTIYQPQELDKLQLHNLVTSSHRLERGAGEGANYEILSQSHPDLIDVRNGQRAAELIHELSSSDNAEPFFLMLGFRRPHLPHIAPEEYFSHYPVSMMPLPSPREPVMPEVKTSIAPMDAREALRGYLACVSFMDQQLKSVIDAMEALSLWEKTIVVFIGDHGYLLGSRGGWWGKGVLYEQACTAPCLIAAPGKAKGRGCSRVVEFVDFYPTLCELTGLPVPKGLEGTSLVPLLENPEQESPRTAYTILAPKGVPTGLAVSQERYRYLKHNDGRRELFDLLSDPLEVNNLAELAESEEILHQMQTLATRYEDTYRHQSQTPQR